MAEPEIQAKHDKPEIKASSLILSLNLYKCKCLCPGKKKKKKTLKLVRLRQTITTFIF